MDNSPIQFQKGLSIPEFLEAYGTEEQCLEALCKMRWPHGFECPECGSKDHCLLHRGLFQCAKCHHQASPIAGTIFMDTKLPLTIWFLAMHLISQGKHSISALELKRQLGVCYETAWNIKQKILTVMTEREEHTRLHGRVEVDDAYMGGEHHEGKRGRGAEHKVPFVAAVETDPKNPNSIHGAKMAPLQHIQARELKPWFEAGVQKGSTVVSDGWKAYNFLNQEGFEHEVHRMPGGWKSGKHPAFKWVNTILGNLKGNITGVTRWVSQVHLDRYLGEFCWKLNRRFNLKKLLSRLLFAAVRTPAMPQPLLKLPWTLRDA